MHGVDYVIKEPYPSMQRYITLPTKVHLLKAVVFPVVMYGCEKGMCERKLSTEELMLLNYGVREDS